METDAHAPVTSKWYVLSTVEKCQPVRSMTGQLDIAIEDFFAAEALGVAGVEALVNQHVESLRQTCLETWATHKNVLQEVPLISEGEK